ncbi:phenylalanine--tRNA ligase subunit alpha [Desulforhabdus amnigena]|jgi:phenylalanyl-tRNA synthetase alpha chain|uniref:Phenylalanine--tRNA ligase alpha subunit n=1 Tax=Desulforhabdus amnigena TaxID=40218 RepID=A0A9W6CYH1_9BACT|nr:phenylalanine--tRNA ligase subunit alpha [Desulforhabdus amnigena]NLJ27056.1 phenylalanine--tRNA ligase subunit alpha [Deltaproteobacteria bacterium]GLI34141.1 phenylalanine--tRNA ligase alpha subunit [Desulforhabdus amnigena]
MEDAVRKLLDAASREIAALGDDLKSLEQVRVRYLGRKGELAQLFKQLGKVSEKDRPLAGKILNEAKVSLEGWLNDALDRAREGETDRKERFDVTIPGRRPLRGRLHPITQTAQEISRIFNWLGFETVEGPEIELDYYNFEALNIPKDHPARDMQDTFYISDDVVLRTHTSPLQVRTMEKRRPPIRVIAPGRTYRCDSDVTHTPMFHQVEGLLVGDDISFGDLKGILTIFVHQMFGPNVGLRFRPSFFPFTEPSAEVDIQCVMCGGKGCRVCSQTGWLEILGSGMVDPEVFKMVGYDPEEITGFAFGMGIERIAMLKFGIDDLRLFYENDLRFLKQF